MQNRLNLCEFGELYALTLILQFSELKKVEIKDQCGWILSEYIIWTNINSSLLLFIEFHFHNAS